MMITIRRYNRLNDFKRVGDFLIEHFEPENQDGNWLQPAWEYMHGHPNLDESSLGQIGVWEEAGEIVGVVNYESTLGEAFFLIHPDYGRLKPAMLKYAEKTLSGEKGDLKAYINDFDLEFGELVRSRGYEKEKKFDRPLSQFVIPAEFPSIILPEGFQLKSLAEENDLEKINRVLWRGFNHPGEPPADEIEGRKKMQSTPNFRKDLTIVVRAPDGGFVSFCGTWYEPIHRIAYVEPVATDPDYRQMGLGKAAVLEGIQRCAACGATAAYVGSDEPFYQALGFKRVYTSECWVKSFPSVMPDRSTFNQNRRAGK